MSAPLQCKLHLNCGVCCLKLKQFSLAIEHASLAIAIAKFSHASETATGVANKSGDAATADLEVWVKGFWIRGSAQLKLNHFPAARSDAQKILKLPGHEENPQALKLLQQVAKRGELVQKKDRQLVKNMSEYLEVAMASSKEGGGGGGGGGEQKTGSAGSKYAHK